MDNNENNISGGIDRNNVNAQNIPDDTHTSENTAQDAVDTSAVPQVEGSIDNVPQASAASPVQGANAEQPTVNAPQAPSPAQGAYTAQNPANAPQTPVSAQGVPNNPQNSYNWQAPTPAQNAVTPYPMRSDAPSGSEFFVGMNVLSKVGVVFIIIGLIAFSAVSAAYFDELPRTLIMFIPGIAMAALGELFYRKKSPVFAGALTIGGIAELFIADIIGADFMRVYITLTVGLAVSAAGVLLSLRYRSQAVMCVTAVMASVTGMASLMSPDMTPAHQISLAPFNVIAASAYMLALLTAATVICRKKQWVAALFVGISCAMITSFDFFVWGLVQDKLCAYIAAAYAVIVTSVYIAAAVVRAMRRCGGMPAEDMALMLIAAIMQMLCGYMFVFAASLTGAGGAVNDMFFTSEGGYVLLFLAAAYCALAFVAKSFVGKSRLLNLFANLTFAAAVPAVITVFDCSWRVPLDIDGSWRFILLQLLAAAVVAVGFRRNSKLFKTWGYTACAISCVCFGFCIPSFHLVQFGISAAIWLALMIVFAVWGVRGTNFNLYSSAVVVNAGIFGSALIFRITELLMLDTADDRVYSALSRGAERAARSEQVLMFLMLSAVLWMLIGFAAGKLRFMRGAEPILSIVIYAMGLLFLFSANVQSGIMGIDKPIPEAIITIAVNFASVVAVLDASLRIQSMAPKFARAVGLVVSAYALMTATVTLGTNEIVAFTSYIISILYISMAVAWILIGFIRENALLRRFGLALALFSSAKLFLFDFAGADDMARTLLFIGFGIVLLVIALIYGYFEKKLHDRKEK